MAQSLLAASAARYPDPIDASDFPLVVAASAGGEVTHSSRQVMISRTRARTTAASRSIVRPFG